LEKFAFHSAAWRATESISSPAAITPRNVKVSPDWMVIFQVALEEEGSA